jgi:hypothetical protein
MAKSIVPLILMMMMSITSFGDVASELSLQVLPPSQPGPCKTVEKAAIDYSQVSQVTMLS